MRYERETNKQKMYRVQILCGKLGVHKKERETKGNNTLNTSNYIIQILKTLSI